MKKWIIIGAILVAVAAILFYIYPNKKDVSGGLSINEKDAVCVFDGIALKDAAGSDGKFIATLNFGEKLICVDQKEVKSSSGNKKYIKVELKGGNSGWVKESSIIMAAKPAVIIKDAIVYQRPDLITKTAKTFSSFDIIAIKEKQGDFVLVYGHTKEGKKVSGAWIKFDAISVDDVDVAVAIYVSKALKLKNANDKMAALKEIIDNPDFRNSCFISELNSMTTQEEPVINEPERPEMAADSVNED